MSLFRNIVFVAALAGLVAGLVMTGMQYATTVPLILKAETFEKASVSPQAGGGGHDHAVAGHDHSGAEVPSHSHDQEEEWAPADGIERSAFTALANVVTAIGFALLLVSVSEFSGGMTGWRQGVFWGLAGFAVFTVAPGLGLPPELPAMPSAELDVRQVWWIATALSTAAGLALIVFRRSLPLMILATVLIAAPHLIGAPKPSSFETVVPERLAYDFVMAAVLTSLIFWVVLGGFAGYFRSRLMRVA